MALTIAGLEPLKVALGAGPEGVFDAGIPVLAGEGVEMPFCQGRFAGRKGAFALFETEGWLWGAARCSTAPDLEATTTQIYEALFEASRHRHLARIWNYIPGINELGPAGIENYRVFCRARSKAFEHRFGKEFKWHVPAGSAVGCDEGMASVVFAALPVWRPIRLLSQG